MTIIARISIAALLFPLAACNNQPEEAPDIAEVIPVEDGTGADSAEATADTGSPEPSASADDAVSGQETMERGSNADGGRPIDPSRSKLLPADRD